MSDTLTTLKTRRSCRAYKPDPVEKEKLPEVSAKDVIAKNAAKTVKTSKTAISFPAVSTNALRLIFIRVHSNI